MENINIKSLIIGALLTSTIFLGVAATSPTDKWDNKQEWLFADFSELKDFGYLKFVDVDGPKGKHRCYKMTGGWEVLGIGDEPLFRKRAR